MNEYKIVGYEMVIFDRLQITSSNESYLSTARQLFNNIAFLAVVIWGYEDLLVCTSDCLHMKDAVKFRDLIDKIKLPRI